MKKYLISLTLLLFLIPSVTFASWWYPRSWFNNWTFSSKTTSKTQILEERIKELENKLNTPTTTPTTQELTKFYVKYDNTRIRKCASTIDCDVRGYYHKNEEVSLVGDNLTINDLPEWIEIITQNGIRGYISKTVLSESPVTNQEKTSPNLKTKTITNEDNAVVTTIDSQIIASNKESIEYLRSEISDVKESIVFFTKLKQMLVDTINNAPKSAIIGDRYSKPTSMLIESLEIDINYFNSVIRQFDNMINVLNNHTAIAQENRKIFKLKVYENDEMELNDAKIFFEQGKRDMEIIFKAYDISNDYGRYKIQQKSFYKQAFQDFMEILNSDIKSLSKTYTPPSYPRPITPTIPIIQFPKTTRCNISPIGGGGVDLVVTCY